MGAIGASKDGAKSEDQFFDINELGADIKLNIPRLFFPFNTEKIIPKYMSPTTNFEYRIYKSKKYWIGQRTLMDDSATIGFLKRQPPTPLIY